jgi:hypothetical protein
MESISGTLSGVVAPSGGLHQAWAAAPVAGDFQPLPAGTYICRAESGERFCAKSGTPGYKITFSISDGEHAGRRVWLDSWLSTAALPYTKRDLAKFNITEPGQLDEPFPRGFRCEVSVILRTEDDGRAFNKVRSFSVIARDELPPVFDPAFPILAEGVTTATGADDEVPF